MNDNKQTESQTTDGVIRQLEKHCYTYNFTWNIEDLDKCPKCKRDTILIYPVNSWAVDEESCSEEDYENELIDGVDVSEEITAHYCFNCHIITSLSFNSL